MLEGIIPFHVLFCRSLAGKITISASIRSICGPPWFRFSAG